MPYFHTNIFVEQIKHTIFVSKFALHSFKHSDALRLDMQFIITQYLQQHLLHHRDYTNYAVVIKSNGFLQD